MINFFFSLEWFVSIEVHSLQAPNYREYFVWFWNRAKFKIKILTEVKSELIRFGELTRIRNGDSVDGVPFGRWAPAAIVAADDGKCGCGRTNVGVFM